MDDGVYILLFRGINVGGRKIVRMEALKKALSDGGFGHVRTYIQSGNVVLTSAKPAAEVSRTVEKVFAEAFGFSSRPTVRSLGDWVAMIERNPFDEAAGDGKRLHAILLDGEPAKDAVAKLEALATTERMKSGKGVLYLHTPDGLGRSPVAAALDRVLGVPITVRNWNTVLKLRELARPLAED
jgi:uncharacterized protein (DUF1697 family)